jgi:hypothetical protein
VTVATASTTRTAFATSHRSPAGCLVSNAGAAAVAIPAGRHRAQLIVAGPTRRRLVLRRYRTLLSFSPSGRRLLLGGSRGHLAILDLGSRRIRAVRKPASVHPDLGGVSFLIAWRSDERALSFLGGRWSVNLDNHRWTRIRVPGMFDAPPYFAEGCFTPGGRQLVSIYTFTGQPVAEGRRLFVSDAIGRDFQPLAGGPGLSPFFASTACTRTGDGRIYLVGGSPRGLYAASASTLDERSPFEP